jgi:ABC-type hemin transport system substrate-binding protein
VISVRPDGTPKPIAEETGMSPGQVLYRLKQAGVKRKDYRNGSSGMAKIVLRVIRAAGQPQKEESATEKLFAEIDYQHEKYVLEHNKLKKKKNILQV